MALRWLEGFEMYGPVGTADGTLQSELRRKYSAVTVDSGSGCSIQTGRGTGLCLQFYTSDASDFMDINLDAQNTWIVGFAYRPSETINPYESYALLAFYNSAEVNPQFSVTVSRTNGSLRFRRGTASSADILGTVGPFLPGIWYYIEIKLVINNTTGELVVAVNGNTELNLTSQDTQNSSTYDTADRIRFGFTTNGSAGETAALDDIYVADGTAGLNSFIGPCKIECLRPSSDDTTDWTPSANGTHYTLVDETGIPSGTDYVSSSTLNQEDVWGYENLTNITGNVKGVLINTACQLSAGGGVRDIKQICDTDGTQSNGTAISIADSASRFITRLMTQDANSTNWTPTTVNSSKFGVQVAD